MVSKYSFPVVQCEECGMGYLQQRPTQETMPVFYPKSFYIANKARYVTDTISDRKLKMVTQFTEKGSLLDIGCAGGEFVDYASKDKWDAHGYEWSDLPDSTCSDRILHGRIQEAYSNRQFDVLTAWAVLEHALNLEELMTEAVKRLRPGGLFVSLVTNFDSIPGRWMQQDDIPRHVNLFTPKSLSLLLEQHGLEPISWDYGNSIYSGSHRGMLVFLVKRLLGESMDSIVAQHRQPGRRKEFCDMLHGKPSRLIYYLSRLDNKLAPTIDAIATRLRRGMIMTCIAKKK